MIKVDHFDYILPLGIIGILLLPVFFRLFRYRVSMWRKYYIKDTTVSEVIMLEAWKPAAVGVFTKQKLSNSLNLRFFFS